ncbi:MAG: aminoacetone oxidase family FAD-binding enzyme, partial [Bacteroidetes bacterium HGW-Bacteroidetes-22]
AADVTDALVKALNNAGVTMRTHCRVNRILIQNECICGIETIEGEQLLARKVILTTGGASYPGTGSSGDGYVMLRQIGHHITPILPALVPVVTKGDVAEKLQGVSLKNVTASVWLGGKKLGEEFGEMLFTHFGLTGPIILTLSRRFAIELTKPEGMSVHIDLKPALDHKKLDERLLREIDENGARQVQNMVRTLLPASMVDVCLNLLAIEPFKPAHQLKADERKKLRNWLKEFCFEVKGVRGFNEAIITKGGVSTREIDPKTLASKKIKGLYFAGELMDVDADTGGYNLQIAFSTGWVAGEAAAGG